MALYNVTTSGNTLLATDHIAHCTSEQVLQNVEDTDFESIRETRVHYQLQNIAEAGSSANTLVTNTPLANGDRIFIRKNNGVIYDTIASGVAVSTATIHPAMTSNTLPQGVATASHTGTGQWQVFDGNSGTGSDMRVDAGEWVQYQFVDNTPTTVYKYLIKHEYGIKAWVIEGSLDGINYSTISSEYIGEDPVYLNTARTFTIDSPGAFSYYRFRITSSHYSAGSSTVRFFYAFHLLSTVGTTADTSAITAGETPDQVFKFEDTISFNGGNAAVEKDIYYEYGTTGLKLYALALYHDVLLDGRILTTRIDFSGASNAVTEITAQVYKLV